MLSKHGHCEHCLPFLYHKMVTRERNSAVTEVTDGHGGHRVVFCLVATTLLAPTLLHTTDVINGARASVMVLLAGVALVTSVMQC